MIEEALTYRKYGYCSFLLKPRSSRRVVAVCEECGKVRDVMNCAYTTLCHRCAVTRRNKVPISEETRAKLSRFGEENGNWKGGITPIMVGVRQSPAYKNWRAAVFERDDYTCQMCNVRGGYLEAHHIIPVRDHKNDLVMWDIDNGATLCKDCHESTKGKEYQFVKRFMKQ